LQKKTSLRSAKKIKQNWFGRTLRKSDESIVKWVIQWTLQWQKKTWRTKTTWSTDLETEMHTAGFKYRWRKEAAGCRQMVCG